MTNLQHNAPHLIAHVDMDCFFAACELRRNPTLQGLPVIVGADKNSQRGVVCTASYQARKFGIKSAMPICTAVKLCPQGIFIHPDMAFYSQESRRIMNLLASQVELFEQRSVDEANLDVTELSAQFDNWLDLAKYIRKLVYEKTGYSCSVGIAQSSRVAKIAAGYKKPHGATAVYDMREFLKPMEINAIPGIGKKSTTYFHEIGIKTIGDLAQKDNFFILDHFGMHGIDCWKLAKGEDYTCITLGGEDKSYSREETYMHDLQRQDQILNELQSLSNEVYADLGTSMYKTVSIKVRYADFTTITRSISLRFTSTSLEALTFSVLNLAKAQIDFSRPIRLLGVKVSNLVHTNQHQVSLNNFADLCSDDFRLDSFQLQKVSLPKMM